MLTIDQLLRTLRAEGIHNQQVLDAIQRVPREQFVPTEHYLHAYENVALPIAEQQTISQPYIVAIMTQWMIEHCRPNKILEIGTGSGYQTAILSYLFKEVWTIERVQALSAEAKSRLTKMGLNNIHYRWGDGYLGWPSSAPFDAIMVTAAAKQVPHALLSQLSAKDGVMLIPLGKQKEVQELTSIIRNGNEYFSERLESVHFVPLIAKRR